MCVALISAFFPNKLFTMNILQEDRASCREPNENETNLLDLPEDIFYEIFRFLHIRDIYFSVRNVSKTMKQYVDCYIELAGVFMLVGGGCSFGEIFEKRLSSEVLYVFKQNSRIISIVSKGCPVLPHPLSSYSVDDIQIETYMEIASFGRLIEGKIVAGYYTKEHWEEQMPVTIWKKQRYRRPSQRSGYRLVPYLFEYERSKKSWLPILPSSTQPLTYRKDITCDLTFCSVGNSMLVRLSINKGGEYGLGEEYDYKIASFKFDIEYKESKNDSDVSNITFSMEYLDAINQEENVDCQLEMTETEQLDTAVGGSDWSSELQKRNIDYTLRESCLIEMRSDRIILFGYQESFQEHTQNRLCQASLKIKGFKMTCSNIDTYIVEDIIRKPICFKLKDNVYIMESFRGIPNCGTQHLKCVRYSTLDKTYDSSNYLLPSLLKSIHAVITDPEEDFAILLGLMEAPITTDINGRFQIHKPRLLIFTEKDGFQQKLRNVDLSELAISAGIGFATSGCTLLSLNI